MLDLLTGIGEMLFSTHHLIQQTRDEWREKRRLSFGGWFCWLVWLLVLFLIGAMIYMAFIM